MKKIYTLRQCSFSGSMISIATQGCFRCIMPFSLSIICFFLFMPLANCQWVKGIGGANSEFGQAIALDRQGNVFVTGTFGGTVDFDPGPGVFNLQSSCPCDPGNPPIPDIFLAKYNSSGDFIWAIKMGGAEQDRSTAVATDTLGNVYITGEFRLTADFDPGPLTRNLISAGGDDMFLAKYDAGGALVWAYNYGGILDDEGTALTVSDSADVFITGSFYGAVDFDPGPASTSFNSNGTTDVFFAKYKSDGNLAWAKQLAGNGEESGRSIARDAAGNLYLTGTFFGTMDLDPGAGIKNVSGAGSQDPFFAKYKPTGELVWGNSIGGLFDEVSVDVAVNQDGDMFVAGYFTGSVDFDPGNTTGILTSSSGGLFDGFLLKLNTDGIFQWAHKIGDTGNDNALSVATDAAGDPYICGSFQGNVDFDPGAGIYNLAASANELYFAKFSSSGNFIWAQADGGAGDDFAADLQLDTAGFVYLTGYFTGMATFNTGTGSSVITSNGSEDFFIFKYQPLTIVPVNMLAFTAERVEAVVLLNWKVAADAGTMYYEIEKSNAPLNPGGNWERIGTVQARQLATGSDYSFPDASPGRGELYYRLKQIEMNGHYSYSKVVHLTIPDPGGYTLDQNRPNPVNGFTRITYSLPAASRVSLRLYDAAGKLVIILADGRLPAGIHQADVDCRRLSPGIYHYILVSENSILTKTMVVR